MSTFEIVRGVEGDCLVLDGTRICGPKPWGGGRVIKTFSTDGIYEVIDRYKYRKLIDENARLLQEIEQWEWLTKNIDLPEYPITQFVPKDLERIVRCRDCKFYQPHTYSHFTCELLTYDADPNGFCAWGERKEVDD